MVVAVAAYAVAAWLQWPGYDDGDVTTPGLVFALIGFVALIAGGWLGGKLVFVHGLRVEVAETAASAPSRADAATPTGTTDDSAQRA
jgi:uncharacterized membrane protein